MIHGNEMVIRGKGLIITRDNKIGFRRNEIDFLNILIFSRTLSLYILHLCNVNPGEYTLPVW